MSARRKTTVGVIFGGRSVEHDVSVVTGNQVINAFNAERFDVVPIYVTREGRWHTGEPLRDLKNYNDEIVSFKGVEEVILSPTVQHHGLILNPISGRLQKSEIKRLDVVFPTIHGSHGEDGTLQGLLELSDIPYVGCGVLASSVANDKALTKDVLRQHGIPVVDGMMFTRRQWLNERDELLEQITNKFPFPIFVKPATLGSSIGVSRVADTNLLAASIDLASNFDRRILVEPAVTPNVEINCSVMGYGDEFVASVLEQPVSWQEFLTYEEKYLSGGEGMKSAERVIPAPIDDALTKKIQQTAIDAFAAIDGRGITRIDFLAQPDKGTFFLNEINTMPGSLSFYLWRENGMSPTQVVERLVSLAQDAYADKRRTTYNYQTSLIELTASRGLKGTKGSKSSP
ncbi:MAG: D-alanine--D-alanine ligase family protein [Aggregatilineales bacterium]